MENNNSANGTKKPLLERRRVWIIAGALCILALAAGAHFYIYYQSHEVTDDAFIEGHVISISPKVPGHVVKVMVDDNQEVREGDLLIAQDPRDYQTRLAMARAGMEAAQAELAQASQDAERYKKLQASDELSKQQLDRALLRLQTAQAQLAKAKAANEQAELELSYTQITAPSSGRVTRKSVEAGAYLQPGQALLAIVTPERWAIANFKETQLTRMRPGQEATMTVDAYPSEIFKGRVDSIQRGTGARFSLLPAENATGNFIKVVQRVPVKITFDEKADRDHPLPLGLSVVVTVKTR